MHRKGFYNVYADEPIYGLVPLQPDRSAHPEAKPTALRVYVCNPCGFLALFSEDTELEWQKTGEGIANLLERELIEEQRNGPS